MSSRKKSDAFICYASEDKDNMARPLAEELDSLGLKVWYDEFSLDVGDSVSQKIDDGITNSKHGIIIVSKNFFKKDWPKREFYDFVSRDPSLKKGVVLPIWYKITEKEIRKRSADLANIYAIKSNGDIKDTAEKLSRKIWGIRRIYGLKSDKELSHTISYFSASMQAKKALLEKEEEELQYIILTKIYLIAKGYRMAYIYYHQFSQLLTSDKKEMMRTMEECVGVLFHKKFITSKALGTISITPKGIKEIENLIEQSFQKKSSSDKRTIASQIKNSIGKSELSAIREIQKFRYDILKQASVLSKQTNEPMNIFTNGQPLGIENETLERIYFYLVDERLIKSYSLGGYFYITAKGRKRVKQRADRIL